jgi:hypothetical protein
MYLNEKKFMKYYKVKVEKYRLYVVVVLQSPWYMLLLPPQQHLSTNYTDWKRGAAVAMDPSGNVSKRRSGEWGLETVGLYREASYCKALHYE